MSSAHQTYWCTTHCIKAWLQAERVAHCVWHYISGVSGGVRASESEPWRKKLSKIWKMIFTPPRSTREDNNHNRAPLYRLPSVAATDKHSRSQHSRCTPVFVSCLLPPPNSFVTTGDCIYTFGYIQYSREYTLVHVYVSILDSKSNLVPLAADAFCCRIRQQLISIEGSRKGNVIFDCHRNVKPEVSPDYHAPVAVIIDHFCT